MAEPNQQLQPTGHAIEVIRAPSPSFPENRLLIELIGDK
jgi:hypothetical protein